MLRAGDHVVSSRALFGSCLYILEEVLVRFYQFSQLPSHTAPGDVVLIVTCSVVISTLAGLLPAWRAARLKPVEALRNE